MPEQVKEKSGACWRGQIWKRRCENQKCRTKNKKNLIDRPWMENRNKIIAIKNTRPWCELLERRNTKWNWLLNEHFKPEWKFEISNISIKIVSMKTKKYLDIQKENKKMKEKGTRRHRQGRTIRRACRRSRRPISP